MIMFGVRSRECRVQQETIWQSCICLYADSVRRRCNHKIKNLINRLPPEEKKDLLKSSSFSTKRKHKKKQSKFLDFVQSMWPAFIEGEHHKIMANAFERVANGELKRLIINMPPRHQIKFASIFSLHGFLANILRRKSPNSTHGRTCCRLWS